ncbi:MAG TPA: carbohydrate ABC transporter permease [Tetrasphaera sp.]|uniref:Carbohydrate ABC transporter permease n=1 Tax=Nostocoides vanveenii TaxID=330835 RepID=A0ABP4WD53_9MICO|nr:carbohydrate ABC transporter permease [Tetrasphaera sp.]HNQ06547.1 carbohydrate ABC transporter permease [Tetrasphaera sp.]
MSNVNGDLAVVPVATQNPLKVSKTATGSGKASRPTQIFLVVMALIWFFPVFYAILNSFRDYAYTAKHGYVSFGGFTMENYKNAWEQANFAHTFMNSVKITVPAVLLTLFLSCCIAFVVARFSFKFNLALLGLFTAANLLPPQALLIPVYRMFRKIPMPEFLSSSGTLLNSHLGLILVNVAFQTGFCSFVLSNYMKTIPRELYESAVVDGAGVLRQFFQLTLPLCRPPLAALATLEVTWIYNEFFWATVLLQQGDKFPVTSSLNNLRGQFFTDNNLVAAGSVLVALPTLIIFFLLQKQFVSGLTLGATKG